MQTSVSVTAIHEESGAVIVLQDVTSIQESSGVWTVVIADQTLTLDRTAWSIITSSIAGTIESSEP